MYKLVVLLSVVAMAMAKPGVYAPFAYNAALPAYNTALPAYNTALPAYHTALPAYNAALPAYNTLPYPVANAYNAPRVLPAYPYGTQYYNQPALVVDGVNPLPYYAGAQYPTLLKK